MGRKVLTIDRCTQKKWVPDGRRSKRFTLQIYEKQRVRASSPCILFPYRPQQKHADARGVGVAGNKREGDRRKPRERRRNPRNRRVGGAGKPSVLHPKAQRRWQTVEHLHQAVEGVDTVGKAEDAGGAADKHATRRVSRSVAGVDQNPLTSRHLHQARQSRPPGRRPSTGRAGKAWRNHVEAQGIFARGNGRMRPRSGRFERGHGRLSALGGKKQHPLRAPGQVGGAAQTNQCRHLEKIDVVNEIRAPLAAPVTNSRRHAPRSPRHTTANRAARRERESPIGPPCGARRELKRHALRSPRRTTANRTARRERESPIGPPCGARRELQRRAPPEAPAAQPQTARNGGSAKALSAHPAAHVTNVEGMPPEAPAAQPQTARNGGSVEGSRGAHADGETRHGASSRRLHRTISPWRGAGSRGATVGRPSAHCASPGRHSGPRPRQPHRPSACAASPSSKAPTA